jgi:sporulation protein YlmC with PRC-barrel domain
MRRFICVVFLLGLFSCWGLQAAALAQDSEEGILDTQAGTAQAQHLRVSELLGKSVSNEQGEELGTVADLIAGKNGGIQYLLISPASGIGAAEKWAPVPWRAADVRVQQDRLILNVSKEQLANAPSFTREELSNLGEKQVERRIYSYYGAEPDQEPNFYRENEQGTSQPSPEASSRSERGAYSYERNPEYQKFGEEHGFYGGMQSWPYSERDRYWPYGDHDRYRKVNTNY